MSRDPARTWTAWGRGRREGRLPYREFHTKVEAANSPAAHRAAEQWAVASGWTDATITALKPPPGYRR